jgi:hypothetical protein
MAALLRVYRYAIFSVLCDIYGPFEVENCKYHNNFICTRAFLLTKLLEEQQTSKHNQLN